MKTLLLGFIGGIAGTLFTLRMIVLVVDVRYFLYASHFCPECGHNKHGPELLGTTIDWGGKCCRCGKVFGLSSDDPKWRKLFPIKPGEKYYSLRFPDDWRMCTAVVFRWKMKKLKERFPRVPNLKASENKT